MTKDALLLEIARSRAAIARDFRGTSEELDVGAKILRSYRKKPFYWLGAAAAIGWMVAGPKRTKQIVKVPVGKMHGRKTDNVRKAGIFGLLITLIRIALPLAKPALSAYAAKRVAEIARSLSKY